MTIHYVGGTAGYEGSLGYVGTGERSSDAAWQEYLDREVANAESDKSDNEALAAYLNHGAGGTGVVAANAAASLSPALAIVVLLLVVVLLLLLLPQPGSKNIWDCYVAGIASLCP